MKNMFYLYLQLIYELLLSTEMKQIYINTLKSDHITPEEQALRHFTRKKLKKITIWNEWKEGEVK